MVIPSHSPRRIYVAAIGYNAAILARAVPPLSKERIMTTANTHTKTPPGSGRFRLPDIPERAPDEKMTSYDHLHRYGMANSIAVHVGNPETTLVEADRWIVAAPGTYRDLARYPDLLVAFDVDPALYRASNGYIISEQGKPPDFVLEVASESTGSTDTGAKRDDYAKLGIPEYWRFDATGQYHGARLAGDRLVNGVYVPIQIDQLPDNVLQGHSPALNLLLRWESGVLGLYDPATEEHIATFESERTRADREQAGRMQADAARMLERAAREQAEARAGDERAARLQERAARLQERAARLQAEAQMRELQAQLQRLQNGN